MPYTDLGELERIGAYDDGSLLLHGDAEGTAVRVDPREMADELVEAIREVEEI